MRYEYLANISAGVFQHFRSAGSKPSSCGGSVRCEVYDNYVEVSKN